MMTLIARLCVLCAMSALMQLVLPQGQEKAGLRLICGLLMLRLTVMQLCDIGTQVLAQQDLAGVLNCLMG